MSFSLAMRWPNLLVSLTPAGYSGSKYLDTKKGKIINFFFNLTPIIICVIRRKNSLYAFLQRYIAIKGVLGTFNYYLPIPLRFLHKAWC